ncbi:hypothetical protein [Exiguobacterium sp. s6]|uniref:hypothetical protein n=1 Tax=Exiguobacterium sp. s6 TaxID=2751236 RepID=UPI001BE80DEC|nr:hypothetical protein [Exiguobacterium sp. s6]
MPIPFILAGAAVVAGAVGVKKGIDAIEKSDEANRITKNANYLLKKGQSEIEEIRVSSNASLEKLGEEKLKLLKQIEKYIERMNKVRNMNSKILTKSEQEIFNELKSYTIEMTNILSNVTFSAGTGAFVAFGAYSGIMSLGSASIGTSLTGVAATNATLAYLGGGSLAAGGYGIAGGTLALGGLVAGPAIAVGGFVMDSIATQKLEEARTEVAKAKVKHEQQQIFTTALENIYNVTNSFNILLLDIRKLQLKADKDLRKIIQFKTDWKQFTKEEKETVHTSLLIAQLSKGLLETNILDDEGGLLSGTIDQLKEFEAVSNGLRAKSSFIAPSK